MQIPNLLMQKDIHAVQSRTAYKGGQIHSFLKAYLQPAQRISIQNISSSIVDDQFGIKRATSNLQAHYNLQKHIGSHPNEREKFTNQLDPISFGTQF